MRTLLATTQSQLAQDVQENADVTEYVNDIYNRGIRNAAAVVYLADVENQSGSGGVNTILSYAKNFGNLGDLMLNEIHITTVCYAYTNRNSWLSQSDTNRKSYITRRINAYTDASDMGWTYCNAGDYRMPSTSPAVSKIGIQWLQNALNRYQNAGLLWMAVMDRRQKRQSVHFSRMRDYLWTEMQVWIRSVTDPQAVF